MHRGSRIWKPDSGRCEWCEHGPLRSGDGGTTHRYGWLGGRHGSRWTPSRPRSGSRHRTRWLEGCGCELCRLAENAAVKVRWGRRAQARFPVQVRQQLLDGYIRWPAIQGCVRDLELTPNQVWGLAQTDQEWAVALEGALTATRRADLKHGTNTAYVAGYVCRECREHQRQRIAGRERRVPGGLVLREIAVR
jgi:hypothetical protein